MVDIKEKIIHQKIIEVNHLKNIIKHEYHHPINKIMRNGSDRKFKNFESCITHDQRAIIAEIKRKSPSNGMLATITSPISLAEQYIDGGASAISVVTDTQFFSGSIMDLTDVSEKLKNVRQPIMQKDFIVDEIQIAQAIAAGADAVLLIASVLGQKIHNMLNLVNQLGIQALVEIQNLFELELALTGNAKMIGVNNRDLTNFEVSLEKSFQLLEYMPCATVKIAESGISQPAMAQRCFEAGFNAVLIGEALVKSSNPVNFIQGCKKC